MFERLGVGTQRRARARRQGGVNIHNRRCALLRAAVESCDSGINGKTNHYSTEQIPPRTEGAVTPAGSACDTNCDVNLIDLLLLGARQHCRSRFWTCMSPTVADSSRALLTAGDTSALYTRCLIHLPWAGREIARARREVYYPAVSADRHPPSLGTNGSPLRTTHPVEPYLSLVAGHIYAHSDQEAKSAPAFRTEFMWATLCRNENTNLHLPSIGSRKKLRPRRNSEDDAGRHQGHSPQPPPAPHVPAPANRRWPYPFLNIRQ
ncbi:hypothetical protein EV426DRAFT_578777 [Tirmania nivea]|nr:hypothetical protein EV426DRAFT_578777 [Tirmania nivea]